MRLRGVLVVVAVAAVLACVHAAADDGPAHPHPHPPAPRAGDVLAGRYELVDKLSKHQPVPWWARWMPAFLFASRPAAEVQVVWRAMDRESGVAVVAKGTRSGVGGKRELHMHALATADGAGGPFVTQFYHGFVEQQRVWLVSELWGESLAAAAPAMALEDKRDVLCSVARGLAQLHGRGIVHHDLSMHNILVQRDAATGGWVPKLADFEVAQHIPDRKYHVTGGTMAFRAPEGLHARPSTRFDMWGFGCVLVELLTGEHPLLRTWGTLLAPRLFLPGQQAGVETNTAVWADVTRVAGAEAASLGRALLRVRADARATAADVLAHPFCGGGGRGGDGAMHTTPPAAQGHAREL